MPRATDASVRDCDCYIQRYSRRAVHSPSMLLFTRLVDAPLHRLCVALAGKYALFAALQFAL